MGNPPYPLRSFKSLALSKARRLIELLFTENQLGEVHSPFFLRFLLIKWNPRDVPRHQREDRRSV